MRARVLVVVATAVMSLATDAGGLGGGRHGDDPLQSRHRELQGKGAFVRGRVPDRSGREGLRATAEGRELQGKTRTNDAGGWTIHLMEAHGDYVAIAPRYEAMHATCDRLASDALDVMSEFWREPEPADPSLPGRRALRTDARWIPNACPSRAREGAPCYEVVSRQAPGPARRLEDLRAGSVDR